MKIEFEVDCKPVSCIECPLRMYTQRSFYSNPQGNQMTYVFQTVMNVAYCSALKKDIDNPKRFANEIDGCPAKIIQ